jgi:hypothetical protein
MGPVGQAYEANPVAKSMSGRLCEAFEYSVVFLFEKVDDIAEKLSDEDSRSVRTFGELKKSVRNIPHELIEQTIQLRARNYDAFENSLTAMCAAVCDTFRPASAAEFVEKLNDDIRSEIELGRSQGRRFAGLEREAE